MDVKLDTAAHTISGHSTIKYVNHSPDILDRIHINLYANSFQEGTVKHREYLAGLGRASRGTKFKKGMDPYFSQYDITNFTINQNDVALADSFRIDDTILTSKLAMALASGDSLVIELDWVHHVGEFAERAGRIGEQYNFAHWYPKMVVYDENGWFDEPFHAEGEFYGEFGTFDVTYGCTQRVHHWCHRCGFKWGSWMGRSAGGYESTIFRLAERIQEEP
jgi:hypothetical protein